MRVCVCGGRGSPGSACRVWCHLQPSEPSAGLVHARACIGSRIRPGLGLRCGAVVCRWGRDGGRERGGGRVGARGSWRLGPGVRGGRCAGAVCWCGGRGRECGSRSWHGGLGGRCVLWVLRRGARYAAHVRCRCAVGARSARGGGDWGVVRLPGAGRIKLTSSQRSSCAWDCRCLGRRVRRCGR